MKGIYFANSIDCCVVASITNNILLCTLAFSRLLTITHKSLNVEPESSTGNCFSQVQAADVLGFESFWIAEHHFHEYGAVPRPAIFLVAAAQATQRIKLGAAVVVLPFDNPLRTAEDFAMVDVLSNGRLVLGVGSGYLKHEFEGFGVLPEEKRGRFDEGLHVLLEA